MSAPSRLPVAHLAPVLLLCAGVFAAPVACVLDTSGSSPGAPTGAGGDGSGGGPGSGGGGPGSGGSAEGGGGSGGGGPASVCGDGAVSGTETCDDGNSGAGDGCAGCALEPGFTCAGEPSVCAAIEPVVVAVGPNLGMSIADNKSYDGSIETMTCATATFADQGFTGVREVKLTIGIQHTWVGDLVIKVVSPQGTVTTVLSRAGLAEPNDNSDEVGLGNSSNLSRDFPITFHDSAQVAAEDMGSGLDNFGVICADNRICDYAPSPGAGPGTNLADFQGEAPAGDWKVCVADANNNDPGSLESVALSVLAW